MNHIIDSILFGFGSGLGAMIMRRYFNFPRKEKVTWKEAIFFGLFNFVFVGGGMYFLSAV